MRVEAIGRSALPAIDAIVLGALLLLAVAWLAKMPKKTKGKAWHFTLAGIPAALFALGIAVRGGALGEALSAWFAGGLAAATLLFVTWVLGSAKRNHGFMDIAYPLAPTVVAWTAFLSSPPGTSGTGAGMAPVILSLVSLWAVRLVIQTHAQNHAEERQPYAAWRQAFGTQWSWWSLCQVYALQGVTLWLWAAPLAFAVVAHFSLVWAVVGGGVWLAGFTLQAVADRQLTRFRADPANRGKILDTGAWSIVRQPNYLGEAVMWWGYFFCALAHPFGFLTIVGPLFATWFMGFGSAGPFKEAHMRRTRGDAWKAYCQRTPRFFPWSRKTP